MTTSKEVLHTQGEHKLTLLRRFNPQKDLRPDGIKKGFIYMHSWATGFQELVFDSHEEAKQYELALNKSHDRQY